ncbi:MAG: ATP-binding protein [Chloroflexi bacterium]|nr:ATP-binding protein [Chloroflexota bacterium]
MQPFDYFDAARFFPSLAPEDRVRAYACFGGVPAYLRHWLPGRGLRENVEQTLLAPGHFLFREGEELLRTEFHQEALYASILRAVATGEERPSDIARAVGRHSANEILDHLRRLQDLQFLRREVPVTELGQARTQRVLYRLADPYLRFWFRYVSPYQSFLQLGKAAELWAREIQPTLDEFVARTTWEEVCLQHLWRRLAADRLPARFAQLGRWWDGGDEIDLVGLWRGRATLVGECKWTATPVGEEVFVALQQKVGKLPIQEPPLWVLASRAGYHPVLRHRAALGGLLLLEPVDLF